MSIQADKWLIRKSTLPSHSHLVIQNASYEWAWAGVDLPETFGQPVEHYIEGKLWRPCTPEDLVRFREDNPSWPLIDDFRPGQVREDAEGNRLISYGNSSFGYDVRCADEFKVFTNINSATVDPKNFDPSAFVDIKSDVCIIPPNSFALARTVEYFKIPRNVLTVCLGKSTYARCGIIVNVTPLEPEWEGHVTLEFSNTTTLPAKIYANEGVAQMLFFEGDEDCLVSYKDRGGKYMKQTGVTLPRA